MMAGSTLTTKGQVTIPKAVRDALGVHAGDRVSFVVREDGVVELRPETVDLRGMYGMLEHAGKPVSVDEMSRAVARTAAASFARSVKR
jgi:AbrB family looped-hinge helix DNA binding protein